MVVGQFKTTVKVSALFLEIESSNNDLINFIDDLDTKHSIF